MATNNATHYDWRDTPDFLALREAFGRKTQFTRLCELNRPLDDMVKAMNAEHWKSAEAIGEEWLQRCPTDIRAHYFTAIALVEQSKEEAARHHFRWARGLMDSIVESGDGETCATAYVTISVAEEYDALFLFGLERQSQAVVNGPHLCDKLTATNEVGEEVQIFFNPAAHFKRLEKLFGEDEGE